MDYISIGVARNSGHALSPKKALHGNTNDTWSAPCQAALRRSKHLTPGSGAMCTTIITVHNGSPKLVILPEVRFAAKTAAIQI